MTLEALQKVLSSVRYKDWRFVAGLTETKAMYLQVQFMAPDPKNPLPGVRLPQHGRKWYISRYAVRSEVVNTALKAVLTAEEHEAREAFLYKGEPIFQTHYDVDELVNFCRKRGRNALQKRIPPRPENSKV